MAGLSDRITIFLRSHKRNLLIIIIFMIIVFSNIFQNNFVMDDYDFIVNWPLIQDWKNLPKFFIGYVPPAGQEGIYSPLKTFFHALTYHLFKLNLFGYHLTSLLIHSLGIFFVYMICTKLTGNKIITFIATLLFSIHPVQVESISTLSGSIDSLGVVFLFISFYFYIEFSQRGNDIKLKPYFYSIFFAFLAIFTHELTISLPLLFLFYDICFVKKSSFKEKALKTLPFFLILAFYVFSKYLVLGSIVRNKYLYNSFYLTMLVSIKAFAKYIYLCFFPLVLTHNHVISKGIYSFSYSDFDKQAVLSQTLFQPQILLSIFLIGLIIYIAIESYEKSPLKTFCIGWFFICLLPVSNIIPSGVFFGERYIYPGLLGFCILMGCLFNKLIYSEKKFIRINITYIAAITFIILIAFYSYKTRLRNKDWKNDMSIFESAVEANPQSALMRNDLGIIYTQYDEFGNAIESFEKALKINPNSAVTYFAMAEAYLQMNLQKNAVISLKKAVELNPAYAEAYYNLAGIYAFWGFKDEAKDNLNQALFYLRKQERFEEAVEYETEFYNYFTNLKDDN